MEIEKRSSGSLLTVMTVAVGTFLGLYLVSRMRRGEEYGEWDVSRHGRRRGLLSRIGQFIPARTKIGAGVGAVKGGVRETIEQGKEKLSTGFER